MDPLKINVRTITGVILQVQNVGKYSRVNVLLKNECFVHGLHILFHLV